LAVNTKRIYSVSILEDNSVIKSKKTKQNKKMKQKIKNFTYILHDFESRKKKNGLLR